MSAMPDDVQIRKCIFTLERARELDEGRDGWITHMGKDASKIEPANLEPVLTSYINKNIRCIVAVHAHGAAPDLQTKGQCVYTSDPGGRSNYASEQEYMQAQREAQLNASEFADYLVKKGLPKEVQELQILACHTDVFAKDLAIELAKQGFENTTVVGYKEEFSICQGVGGSSLAGLCPELTPEIFDKKGKIIWDNLNKEIKLKHAADKHEARFNTSDYLKYKKEDASASSSSFAPPAAAAAAAASSSSASAASQLSPLQTRAARAEAASIARMERARAEAEALKKPSSPAKASTPQFASQQAHTAALPVASTPKKETNSHNAISDPASDNPGGKKHKGP